jgi:O-glycosyl hydrolase
MNAVENRAERRAGATRSVRGERGGPCSRWSAALARRDRFKREGRSITAILLCASALAGAGCGRARAGANEEVRDLEERSAGSEVSSADARVAEVPTGTPAEDEVRVNETKRYQTLDGVGTNAYAFPIVNDFDYDWSKVNGAFDEVNIEYVRLASWFQFWEPENDDDDATTTNWDAFDPSGIIANHDLAFAKWLTDRGIEVELGVWSVGEWLANGDPNHIDPSLFPELGESIASYMKHMQDEGVPQRFVEVQNEPGITAGINYATPEDLRDAGLALLDALDAAGFEDVKLHGPNFHAPDEEARHWAEVWFENERLRDRTEALSYHTWWHDDFESYDAIREIAERYDKPVWATEVGYCAIPDGCDNGHYLRPDTWATAWDYALSYYRAIAWSHASRLYHWTLVGFDAAVNPSTGERLASFYALKHFANYIEPGARMLDVASGDPRVLAVAFLLPSGERTVIVLNDGDEAKSIALTSVQGLDAHPTEAVTTTEGSYEERARVRAEGDGVRLDLPAKSMTSLRFNAVR